MQQQNCHKSHGATESKDMEEVLKNELTGGEEEPEKKATDEE